MKSIAVFLILFGFNIHAQSSLGGILINADTSDHDTATHLVHLQGHVQLVFKGNHMRADQAEVDLNNKIIRATGRIVLENQKVHLEGERAVFNYETIRGTIYKAFLKSGQVVFEGDEIEKTGAEEYVAINGRYTACANCPADWSFSGVKIKATLGGYAKITYPIFRVFGVPVFIFPYLPVPLKSNRQSGFLVPAVDFSGKGGVAGEIPYFWAISKSQDMTLTAKSYSQRGQKGLVEYRYKLSPLSDGILHSAYMKDNNFTNVNNQIVTQTRWFLDYHHYYDLPENYVHRLKLSAAGDLRYQRDFPLELKGNGDPAFENRMSVTKNTENSHISAETAYYINLFKQDPLANNEDAVHRLPELRYNLVQKKLGHSGLFFQADMDYTNFFRSNFSYDNVVCSNPQDSSTCRVQRGPDNLSQYHSGMFNSTTDTIRTGQRLDLNPRLTAPFRVLNIFDFLPAVSYHETQYAFNLPDDSQISQTAARRYLQADLGVRTRLTNIYTVSETEKVKHIIEPGISYSTIPWIRQPNHIFFGDTNQPFARTLEPISDNDFTGSTRIQFDNFDRVYDKRVIDFGVTNYFNRRRSFGDQAQYKNIVTWRLSESYDVNEAHSDLYQPWSSINSVLDMRFDHIDTFTTNSYYPYARITNTSSRVRIKNDRGDFLELNYVHEYLISLKNEIDMNSKTENLGLNLGYVSRFLHLVGGFNFSAVTHTVQSWQYIAKLRPPGGCWGIDIGHHQVIGGDVQLKFNFAFDFGGQHKLN